MLNIVPCGAIQGGDSEGLYMLCSPYPHKTPCRGNGFVIDALERCLENLREVVERKGEEPEEEICAWCGEDEDKKLFLCDGDDCGRYEINASCLCRDTVSLVVAFVLVDLTVWPAWVIRACALQHSTPSNTQHHVMDICLVLWFCYFYTD